MLEGRKLPSAAGVGHVVNRVSALVATAQNSAHSASAPSQPADQSSFTVPLSIVDVGNNKRLGVQVSVAGSPLRTYLLDTGSTGMYLAKYKLHKSDYSLTSQTFAQKYTSGIHYDGVVAKTSVAFENGPKASGVYVGLIQSVKGIPGWKSDLRRGKPPYEGKFYGTLGMSLVPGQPKKQGNLYSIIAQLPGNLSSGFIIHTGGIDGTSPTLTIGLNSANTRGFTTVPMPAANGTSQATPYAYGNGLKNHVLAWNDKGVNLNYGISGLNSFSAKSIFDTGEPSTTLYPVKVPRGLLNGQSLINGLLFEARITPGINWRFLTGPTANVNQVDVGPNTRGTVNTGIGLFFHYDVMYDLADGTIGFRPISSQG